MQQVSTLSSPKQIITSFLKSDYFKILIGCFFVGLGFYIVGAHADIVSYDSATGAATWDFSSIVSGFVSVLVMAITASATLFGIIVGWKYFQGLILGGRKG